MSRTVGRPKRSSTNRRRIERLQRLLVAHQRAHVAAAGRDDLLGDAIGFRMHGGGVERLAAVADAQEAGALLERARAEPADLQQILAAVECAVGVAMRDDRLRERRAEAGHARQQRRGRRIEIDADGVDGVLDHRLQRAAEPVLVDVVLILPDADRLRLDLDEFGQRVLQPARNRHRAAQRDVEPWKLRRGERGGRINRGAGFADDRLDRLRSRQRSAAAPRPCARSRGSPCRCRSRSDRPCGEQSAARARPARRAGRCAAGTDRRSPFPAACRFASTTATFTPVRMPGSSPIVARGPAGAASSRSFRLRANTLIASSSAFSRNSTIRSSDSEVDSFTRQVQRATSFNQRSPGSVPPT